MVELSIVRIKDPGRKGPSIAHWNHREGSARIILFQHPHDSYILAHVGKVILRRGPIEVCSTINHEGFAMLLKHLLLKNRDDGGLTAAVVSWSRVAAEDANSRIGRQLRIDVADGCQKV